MLIDLLAKHAVPKKDEKEMIFGVGVDIVQLSRIAKALEKSQGRLVDKILGAQETCQYHAFFARHPQRSLAYLATRFAVKEACAKALGLGLRWPMAWHAVQALNAENGRPQLHYAKALEAWLVSRGLILTVSLSHEREYAIAHVTAWENTDNGCT